MATELVNLTIPENQPARGKTHEKPKRPRGRPSKETVMRERGGLSGGGPLIDLERMVQLRKQGLGYADIGRLVGCNRTNVRNRLIAKGIDISVDLPAQIRKARADMLAVTGARALENITDAKLKRASPKDCAIVFNIAHQAERLELGKSTSNVSYAQMLVAGQDDEEKLRVIEAEIVSRETL